jgi:hypothetical protein
MANSVTMQGPIWGTVICNAPSQTGQTYTPDGSGFVSVDPRDVVSMFGAGFAVVASKAKNNLVATTDPGVSNDATQDYGKGSQWLNTSTGALWECTDPTAGAAVWQQVGGGAGSYTGHFDGIIGATTPAAAAVTTLTGSGLATVGQAKVDTGTKTATASSGAATLSKNAGVITTEALTTAGLADYTLTLTNTAIAAADQLMVSVGNGSNTQGDPVVGAVTPGAGSAVIVIRNAHATQALNGTLRISFVLFKN